MASVASVEGVRVSVGAMLAVLGTVLVPVHVHAQQVPVFLVGSQGDPIGPERPAVNRVAAALGPGTSTGTALTEQIAQRYASPPLTGDPLSEHRTRARRAQRAWAEAAAAGDGAAGSTALEEIELAARAMEAQPEALDQHTESRRALEQSLVFLAERYDGAGLHTRAEDAMRRLAAVDPAVVFTASAASPAVQQYYARSVQILPRGALTVDSLPARCTVVRDGRDAGTAPVELQDLSPGAHRVSIRCGAIRSLVHRVEIAPRTRATLVIDAELDAALETTEIPALRYATGSQVRTRVVADLAQIGRALGARRIAGVIAREDRVLVVDVTAGAAVGEANVVDGTALRALLVQPVLQRMSAAPATSATPATTATVAVAASPRTHTAPADARDVEEAPMLRVRRGVPAGAFLLAGLGLGAVGAGVYGTLAVGDARNQALQATRPADRLEREDEALPWQFVQWGGYGVGATLIVTGVLVGLFAGGEDTIVRVPRVRASVSPLPGGAMGTVEARF